MLMALQPTIPEQLHRCLVLFIYLFNHRASQTYEQQHRVLKIARYACRCGVSPGQVNWLVVIHLHVLSGRNEKSGRPAVAVSTKQLCVVLLRVTTRGN